MLILISDKKQKRKLQCSLLLKFYEHSLIFSQLQIFSSDPCSQTYLIYIHFKAKLCNHRRQSANNQKCEEDKQFLRSTPGDDGLRDFKAVNTFTRKSPSGQQPLPKCSVRCAVLSHIARLTLAMMDRKFLEGKM